MIAGVCFEKGRFRVAWLDGTKGAPVLIDRERCINPHPADLNRTAVWLDGRLEQLLRKHVVDSFVCKISYDLSSQEKVITHGAPLGILALRAQNAGKPLTLITKIKLKNPKTYSLLAGSDPYVWINAVSDGRPYWDGPAKDAALAACSALP